MVQAEDVGAEEEAEPHWAPSEADDDQVCFPAAECPARGGDDLLPAVFRVCPVAAQICWHVERGDPKDCRKQEQEEGMEEDEEREEEEIAEAPAATPAASLSQPPTSLQVTHPAPVLALEGRWPAALLAAMPRVCRLPHTTPQPVAMTAGSQAR